MHYCHKDGFHANPHKDKYMKMMKKKLDLTDEQVEQIKEIRKKHKADQKTLGSGERGQSCLYLRILFLL